MIRTPPRFLLFVVLTIILMVYGISIARSPRALRTEPVDCSSDCRDNRDKMLEKCDTLPEGNARDNCKERATKQYDKCVERCNSGQSGPSANPGGF